MTKCSTLKILFYFAFWENISISYEFCFCHFQLIRYTLHRDSGSLLWFQRSVKAFPDVVVIVPLLTFLISLFQSATAMKKCCSRSLSIPILYLSKMHHADFCNFDFSFKLSAITRFCSSRVALRELDREIK